MPPSPPPLAPGCIAVRRDAGYLRSIALRMRQAAVELSIADVLDELERAAQGGQMSAVIDVPDRLRALDKPSVAEALAEALGSVGMEARPVRAMRTNRYGPDSETLMIEASWREPMTHG